VCVAKCAGLLDKSFSISHRLRTFYLNHCSFSDRLGDFAGHGWVGGVMGGIVRGDRGGGIVRRDGIVSDAK
jgi:hypothetical protein